MAGDVDRRAVHLVAAGAAAQVVGLAIDAWLHGRDSGLAARESVFTLGNAGHVLLLAGLALVVLGTAAGLWPPRTSGRRRGAAGGLVAVAAVSAVAVALGAASLDGEHAHSEDARAHGTRPPPASGASGAVGAAGGHGAHGGHDDHGGFGPVAEEPVTGAQQAELERQWAVAQAVAAALATVEDAAAAGYRQSSAQAPGIGTHWIHWDLIDEGFDPARPSMLLYDRSARGGDRLAGFSYWVRSAVEPEGFAGPNDHWHQHHGLCFVDGWLQREGIGDPADCEGHWVQGGDRWMLHAWVVPGMENRWGRFAPRHPGLCPLPTAVPDILTCSPLQT